MMHKKTLLGLVAALGLAACGGKDVPPNPPCEQECLDAIAVRALRETMKFAFNSTFQGQPYGTHDITTTDFLRGSARVRGSADSIPELGVTRVDLTYEFTLATYFQKDTEPRENFAVAVNGVVTQVGKLAVQPSSPTSLIIKSDAVVVAGKVYDPPVDYNAELASCSLELNQNGNRVSGKFCDRDAGFEF
ncbi:MAG: hypothetical protein ABW133_24065 [Polyangiaceae bacterium]